MASARLTETIIGLQGLVRATAPLEIVAQGSIWAEGPLWIPARGCLRWSDIPNNRIREYEPASGLVRDYATDAGFANGRALDVDGSVVQCSHGRRRIERDRGGLVSAIVDEWQGVRLNSPNDVVIAPDGAIWFTDPAYGITEPREGYPGRREYGDHYVFRYDQTTGETAPVVIDVEEPNGLGFSPDGALFYVADSSSVRKPPGIGNAHIRVYDVQGGVRCKNGRVFARIDQGFPDGFAVDALGNIWSSSAVGVIVFDPGGAELGRVIVPELTGNLCFGGPDGHDLYIAASTCIYRIRTQTHAAWPQGLAAGKGA